MREAHAEDGALLRFSILDEHRNHARRTQRAQVRYERHTGGGVDVVERE